MEQLTYEQQIELHAKAKTGDMEARNRLAMGMKGLAHKVAAQYMVLTPSYSFDDCLQDAMLAVMRAVDAWEPARAKLTTLVGLYVQWEMLGQICEQQFIQAPQEQRVKVDRVLKNDRLSESHDGPEDRAQVREVDRSVREAIAGLPEEWREVMEWRLDGETLEEIGGRLGVSRQRVGQIVQFATRHLKRKPQIRKLATANGWIGRRKRRQSKDQLIEAPAGTDVGRAA
jgi:RNA polymerase sigma factor (sigma-70 family)